MWAASIALSVGLAADASPEGDEAIEALLSAGASPDAPAPAGVGEGAQVARRAVTRPALAAQGAGRGTRSFALRRGGGLVEALAATGRDEEARVLLEAILCFDDTPETRGLMREHLGRSGSTTLLPLVAERRGKEVRVR